jgi:hypothetical protein
MDGLSAAYQKYENYLKVCEEINKKPKSFFQEWIKHYNLIKNKNG